MLHDPLEDLLAARSTAPPASMRPTGGVPVDLGEPPPNRMQQISEILRLAIPSLIALTKGGSAAGSYLAGQSASEDRFLAREREQEELGLRRSNLERQTAIQERLGQREERMLDQQEFAQGQAKQKAEDEKVGRALEQALGNRSFREALEEMPTFANQTSISVPGIGNINLRDALLRFYSQDQSGQWLLKDLPPEARTPLITTPGPGGKPVRSLDVEGKEVYERPRAPQRLPLERPKKPSLKMDRANETYTIDDGQGAVVVLTPEDLDAIGIPPSALPAILNDPPALKELLESIP